MLTEGYGFDSINMLVREEKRKKDWRSEMWILSAMLLSVILIGIFPRTFGKFIICVVMPLMGFVIGGLLTYIVGIGPAFLAFSEYSKTGDTGTLEVGVIFSLLSLILPVGMICYALIFHAVYSKASDTFDNIFMK